MKRYRQQINVSNNVLRDKMHHIDDKKKQQLITKERQEQDSIDKEISTFGVNIDYSAKPSSSKTTSGEWLERHKIHLQMMKQSEDLKLKKNAVNFKMRHKIFDDVADMNWPSQEQKLLDIYGIKK